LESLHEPGGEEQGMAQEEADAKARHEAFQKQMDIQRTSRRAVHADPLATIERAIE
jgi:hypothetical protein